VNNKTGSRLVDGVHAIRKLPSANIKAIINLLNWGTYADDENNIDIMILLADLNIGHDNSAKDSLVNLVSFMKDQSKTCLQGVSLVAYKALKEKLMEQSGTSLNVQVIWEHILTSLREKILSKKLGAFSIDGPYHSLSMMLNHQLIKERRRTEFYI